jgi:hypothetical protein
MDVTSVLKRSRHAIARGITSNRSHALIPVFPGISVHENGEENGGRLGTLHP